MPHFLAVQRFLFLLIALLIFPGPGHAADRDVRVGAFITNLSNIDQANSTFEITFYAWFIDPAGTFDPRTDMYVIARSSSIDEVEVLPLAGGATNVTARISAVVDQAFDLSEFPFDSQVLVVRLEGAYGVDELRFVPDHEPPQVADYVRTAGWGVDGVSLTTDQHSYTVRYGLERAPDSFSQANLGVEVKRLHSPIVVDDFLGFIFAFVITSLTFFIPCKELGLRIGMTSGSLFAAILNLNRLLDAAGFQSVFGLVERVGFLVLGALVTAMIISIQTKRLAERRGDEYANRIDSILGAVVVSVFLVLIVATIYRELG